MGFLFPLAFIFPLPPAAAHNPTYATLIPEVTQGPSLSQAFPLSWQVWVLFLPIYRSAKPRSRAE